MTNYDFSKFKCRSSAISKIMSNSRDNPQLTDKQAEKLAEYRSKIKCNPQCVFTTNQQTEYTLLLQKESNRSKVILSDTCIQYLMEVYAWETQGMVSVSKESMDLLQIKKGKMMERQSGDLLCRVYRQFYKEHKERISNEFLTGEIDLYVGDHVLAAKDVTDVKNCFDYPTFLRKINSDIENGYDFQIKGYGDITGAKELYCAYTLVTAPDEIIEDMKWKLARKLNALTIESPDFLEEWKIWEHSMKFDHIPVHKRAHRIKVEPFTDTERQKVYDRVKVCRDWLCSFDEKYQNLNFC